ncbi:uncharacterized protein FOMMEDRAFT_28155 [Fomitiporia mediterranea MF3/22]|uniref:uncharacterized protein n=1 Tax=Fomitiporia mediterranea (strain MF3/22) TaxID=694068 RepID=UPI000440882F|nr:uncharacterized protein FOMMEDRAFT_28155 [Fomitiporia mediterranea MF3/22]EJD04463.1 hypothetical protein FOMMEDRAFT_28155 [Fomitiporia mediterranea MF3/22]
MLHTLKQIFSGLLYHTWTVFLFTKSNFKDAVMPLTALGIFSDPPATFTHVLHTAFWSWFLTFQHNIANQILHPEEDEHNKPFRPIPAKRITLKNARILRWVLVPACLALSAYYSVEVLYQCIPICILFFAYNDLDLNNHWFLRNAILAAEQWFFGIGVCLIAGTNRHELDNVSKLSSFLSMLMLATTFHAQDFRDTVGDKLVGRKTIPIVWPRASRPTLLLILLAWSSALCVIWKVALIPALAYHLLALAVGCAYLTFPSSKADDWSYFLYNVWLSVGYAGPAYYRLVAAKQAPFAYE